jgi:hypothetical protein
VESRQWVQSKTFGGSLVWELLRGHLVLGTIFHCQKMVIDLVCDGYDIKISFYTCVVVGCMEKWCEHVDLVMGLELSEDDDYMICEYCTYKTYSVTYCYFIVNNIGIMFPQTCLLRLCVSPRIHVLLRNLINNKLFTRDKLNKSRHLKDKTCVLFMESENPSLIFYCVIASSSKYDVGMDFRYAGNWWLSEKKYIALNMVLVATLRCLWMLRHA